MSNWQNTFHVLVIGPDKDSVFRKVEKSGKSPNCICIYDSNIDKLLVDQLKAVSDKKLLGNELRLELGTQQKIDKNAFKSLLEVTKPDDFFVVVEGNPMERSLGFETVFSALDSTTSIRHLSIGNVSLVPIIGRIKKLPIKTLEIHNSAVQDHATPKISFQETLDSLPASLEWLRLETGDEGNLENVFSRLNLDQQFERFGRPIDQSRRISDEFSYLKKDPRIFYWKSNNKIKTIWVRLTPNQQKAIKMSEVYKIHDGLELGTADSKFRVIECYMIPGFKSHDIEVFGANISNKYYNLYDPEAFPALVFLSGSCQYTVKKIILLGRVKKNPKSKYPTITSAKILKSEQSYNWRKEANLDSKNDLLELDVQKIDALVDTGCIVKRTKWRQKKTNDEVKLVATHLEIESVRQSAIGSISKFESVKELTISGSALEANDYRELFAMPSLRTLVVKDEKTAQAVRNLVKGKRKIAVLAKGAQKTD